MTPEKIKKLTAIAGEILMCKECSFHRQLLDMDIPYRPDAPLGYTQNSTDYQVVAVGINPGWNDEIYRSLWKEIYREKDLEAYKFKYFELLAKLKEGNQEGRQPYRDSIYYTFEKINAELGIYENTIKREDIFDYIFYSNLSFCSSQNVGQRKFDGKELPCDVFNEEIPNCLRKGYLKRIIDALEPRLVMFFGYEAANVFNFSKIFDKNNYDNIKNYPKTLFPSQKRGETIVNANIMAGKLKVKGKETAILFLPHPNYRFNSDYKSAALEEVCTWLKRN